MLNISGCSSTSTNVDKSEYPNADVRAIPYIKTFERLYGRSIKYIDIKFTDLPGAAGGVCNMLSKKIRIDEPSWKRKTKYQKEEVIFHELGHCVLGLGHDYYQETSRCPRSVMFWRASYRGCYKRYRNYYRKEIFFRYKERFKIWKPRKMRKL
jgi:hypothetical protein